MEGTTALFSSLKSDASASKDVKVTFSITLEDDIITYLKGTTPGISAGKCRDFVKIFLSPDTEDSLIINWLKQFKDSIFFLDKENEHITAIILNLDWTSRNNDVVSVYQELILNLVSAHTYYLRPVFDMIIKNFCAVIDDGDFVTKEENDRFQKAHKLLQNIVLLVPLSPSTLCPMLAEKFPYLKRSTHKILCYFVNMLNICTYLPSYRSTILEYLIDRMLYIDVHCPKDEIQMYELEKDEEEHLSGVNSFEKITENTDSMAFPLANTLDLLMHSLLKFIECTCFNYDGKELNWEATKKLFRELLTIFDKLILSTHGSSHVQFIMFYICSLKPALCEGFVDYLWKKVQNPNTPPVLRQMATFYIGSLLARASYINISTVTACFDLMCNWVHSYIKNQDTRDWGDVAVHTTFHCVCQTLFYVFAFRHKELIEIPNSFKYLRNLNFERIVTCRLNPLKYCQPTIVQNFASVTRNYQIAYCYPIIEKNNRLLMATCLQKGSVDGLHVSSLNTVFPFDPYVLKRSKKWITPIYRLYNSHGDDEQEEENSSFMEEEEAPVSNNIFSYGTSPGFKQNFILSSRVR